MRIKVDKVGEIGVVKDIYGSELPPNAWTRVKNVRFMRGYATPMLGHRAYLTPPGEAQYILGLSSRNGYFIIYPVDTDSDGLVDAIYTYNGSIAFDISNGTYSGASKWTGCVLNGVAILNSQDNCPQYYAGTGTCEDLIYSGSDTWNNFDGSSGEYRAKVIRSYRNFLFALDIKEDGVQFPWTVHWSDPADPGSIPASWDYADPTTLSGRVDLSDTNGRVVDGLALRDTFVIYKEDAVWIASYVEGRWQFRFDKLTDTHGIYGIGCVADIGGRHLVVGDGVVYVHDGNSIVNVLEGRNADYLFRNINTDYKDLVFVCHNRKYREAWICFPTVDSTKPNMALIYNYENNTWTNRDLPDILYASEQILSESGSLSWPGGEDTISGWGDIGDDNAYAESWDEAKYSGLNNALMGAGTQLWWFDKGKLFGEDFPICMLERVALRFGEGGQRAMIRAIYPRATGSELVFRVGMHHKIDGGIKWGLSKPFDPGVDIKVDVRQTGEMHAIRITGTFGSLWRLYGYEIDIAGVGAY